MSKNRSLMFDLSDEIDRVHHICLLTLGQVLVYDKDGNTLKLLQSLYRSTNRLDKTGKHYWQEMVEAAKVFTICNLFEGERWQHEVTKTQFKNITNTHLIFADSPFSP